jgi:glycerate kinase
MDRAPRLLIAPDSFKGTFSAVEIAAAIGAGALAAGVDVDLAPVADGGEGTMEILVEALGGRIETAVVTGPFGQRVTARYGLLNGGSTAVIEAAEACGLSLSPAGERDAEAAGTRGVGELLLIARRQGVRRILVTVGGSATTDGGRGALDEVRVGGGLGGVELEVLCDVSVAFEDAAQIFAPQKGASPAAVARLSDRLARQAAQLPKDPRGVPMTGAAGGLSGGLWAALGATLRPGADYVLDAIGIDARLAHASAVVTGEGRLDEQSLQGKLVGAIAERARRADVPLHAVVGCTTLGPADARALGLASVREAPTLADMKRAGRDVTSEINFASVSSNTQTVIPTYANGDLR